MQPILYSIPIEWLNPYAFGALLKFCCSVGPYWGPNWSKGFSPRRILPTKPIYEIPPLLRLLAKGILLCAPFFFYAGQISPGADYIKPRVFLRNAPQTKTGGRTIMQRAPLGRIILTNPGRLPFHITRWGARYLGCFTPTLPLISRRASSYTSLTTLRV